MYFYSGMYHRLFSINLTRCLLRKLRPIFGIIDSIVLHVLGPQVTSANIDRSGSNCIPIDGQRHVLLQLDTENSDSLKQSDTEQQFYCVLHVVQ